MGKTAGSDSPQPALPVRRIERRCAMIFLRIYGSRERCRISKNSSYLMLASNDLDQHGNWMLKPVAAFRSVEDLKAAIERFLSTGSDVVIQAAPRLSALFRELGLEQEWSQWRSPEPTLKPSRRRVPRMRRSSSASPPCRNIRRHWSCRARFRFAATPQKGNRNGN